MEESFGSKCERVREVLFVVMERVDINADVGPAGNNVAVNHKRARCPIAVCHLLSPERSSNRRGYPH